MTRLSASSAPPFQPRFTLLTLSALRLLDITTLVTMAGAVRRKRVWPMVRFRKRKPEQRSGSISKNGATAAPIYCYMLGMVVTMWQDLSSGTSPIEPNW